MTIEQVKQKQRSAEEKISKIVDDLVKDINLPVEVLVESVSFCMQNASGNTYYEQRASTEIRTTI